ncbi:MAG: hypothetical protein ABEJ22_06270 [Haloferacaceae archaeon]
MLTPLQVDLAVVANGVNYVWVLVASFLIFFMQPGFALLEAEQVRAKNVGNVLMKNMTDWALGGLGGALVLPSYHFTVGTLHVDDVCGVFAVHGVTGAAGTALVPVFGVVGGSWTFLGWSQLAMQVVGVAVIALWTLLASGAAFAAIDAVWGLRVSWRGSQPAKTGRWRGAEYTVDLHETASGEGEGDSASGQSRTTAAVRP